MDSELLVIIEDALRARFGDGIKVERTVNDTTGEVRVAVYRDAPNFAKHISLTKDLIQQYDEGSLLA